MNELIEAFLNRNNHREDTAGLKSLVSELGYTGFRDFFDDNQGAVEAVINWVAKQRCDEWKDALTVELRYDIQLLLDGGFIERDEDIESVFNLKSTNNIVLVEDIHGNRHVVGSISLDGDTVLFYDEADAAIVTSSDSVARGIVL